MTYARRLFFSSSGSFKSSRQLFDLRRPPDGACHFLCLLWLAKSHLISIKNDGDIGTAVRWLSFNLAQLACLGLAKQPSVLALFLSLAHNPSCLPRSGEHRQHLWPCPFTSNTYDFVKPLARGTWKPVCLCWDARTFDPGRRMVRGHEDEK